LQVPRGGDKDIATPVVAAGAGGDQRGFLVGDQHDVGVGEQADRRAGASATGETHQGGIDQFHPAIPCEQGD
jgi:hypothetical protein